MGAGTFVGYLVSQTVGIVGDSARASTSSGWAATVALLVGAGLLTVSAALVRMSLDDRQPPVKSLAAPPRDRDLASAEIWSLWLPTGFK